MRKTGFGRVIKVGIFVICAAGIVRNLSVIMHDCSCVETSHRSDATKNSSQEIIKKY